VYDLNFPAEFSPSTYLLLNISPFVLSERVGVDNFIVINQEDMTPLSEKCIYRIRDPKVFSS